VGVLDADNTNVDSHRAASRISGPEFDCVRTASRFSGPGLVQGAADRTLKVELGLPVARVSGPGSVSDAEPVSGLSDTGVNDADNTKIVELGLTASRVAGPGSVNDAEPVAGISGTGVNEEHHIMLKPRHQGYKYITYSNYGQSIERGQLGNTHKVYTGVYKVYKEILIKYL